MLSYLLPISHHDHVLIQVSTIEVKQNIDEKPKVDTQIYYDPWGCFRFLEKESQSPWRNETRKHKQKRNK